MKRVLAVLILLTAQAVADPRIGFDTAGGEAWEFTLQIAGHASREECDAVTIESPLGRTRALLADDRFDARVALRSGENRIEAICSKTGREVVRSEAQVWRVALPDAPKARIRLRVLDSSISLDAGATELAPVLPAPIVKYEWRARAGNPEALQLSDGEKLEIPAPKQDGDYYVDLQVTDRGGRSDRSAAAFRVVHGRAQEIDPRTEHPSWVDTAVVYGAAPYFFEPANFHGVAERLDEIAALGATVVWLSPVTAAASGDFGYAVTDQFGLREQFGSERDFRALVDAAHRAGLRVLVDFVPNHLADQSSYFRNAARNGERSPYYDWFDRDTGGEITHYFDWQHLANLNYDNAQVRGYVTAAFARFVRDFGVDGFRVDASWAVARRAPEFWPQLRAELKRIDPDIVLLAEASAREPYWFSQGFDAAYDWTSRLGEWAWREAFAEPGVVNLASLRRALTNDGKGLVPDALVLRFLNNNDTGVRFVTRFGQPLAKVAATLLFTLPGLPLIYNGDEAGASFEPYDEGPPIRWDDGGELARHYRKLTALRRQTAALQTRDLQLLSTDRDEAVLAYVRPGATPALDLLVMFNVSGGKVTVRGADAATQATLHRFARSRDLLNGIDVRARGGRFALPPYSAAILRAAGLSGSK